MTRKIVTLVPAYNEQDAIGATIEALLEQTRMPDVIVIIPNGCTDRTAEIARSYVSDDNPLVVFELPRLEHKKSEALNKAWVRYGLNADIIVCLDADTICPPDTIRQWELDFVDGCTGLRSQKGKKPRYTQPLGGVSSKATMPKPGFWSRLQKAEFAKWTDTSLIRGYTTVLAGTGCAIDNKVLRQIVSETGRPGPWSYTSAVEDFELTTQIRIRGYRCIVSPHVRVYTDSMTTLRTLWPQRMKWATGTIEELFNHGFNRYTIVDWSQQALGLFMLFARLLWVTLIVCQVTVGFLRFDWFWWVLFPLSLAIVELWFTSRIPNADWKDRLLAATIVPYEIFGWIRAAWFAASWYAVLCSKLTGRRKDRWEAQYRAEGIFS